MRVFAFLLLDCAERRPEGGLRSLFRPCTIYEVNSLADIVKDSVRLIKVALKTARHCLGISPASADSSIGC